MSRVACCLLLASLIIASLITRERRAASLQYAAGLTKVNKPVVLQIAIQLELPVAAMEELTFATCRTGNQSLIALPFDSLLVALGSDVHPFRRIDLKRAFRFGSQCRWDRFLHKLAWGGTARVIVVGISNLRGRGACGCPGCSESQACTEARDIQFQKPFKCVSPRLARLNECFCCSWASLLFTWLQSTFPRTKFTFVPFWDAGPMNNFGRYFDTFMADGMKVYPLTEDDVVLVNFPVVPRLLPLVTSELAPVFQKLAESPAMGIVVIDAQPSPIFDALALNYSVALFDFPFALRLAQQARQLSKHTLQTINHPLHREGWPHPPWWTHQLMADAAALGIVSMLEAGPCSPSNRSHRRANRTCSLRPVEKNKISCRQRSVHFSAKGAREGSASNSSGHVSGGSWIAGSAWRVEEDRVGKPGWIITHGRASAARNKSFHDEQALQFLFPGAFQGRRSLKDFNCKLKVHLDISYMKTYRDAGRAELFVCGRFVATLDALWGYASSVEAPSSFDVDFGPCLLYPADCKRSRKASVAASQEKLRLELRYAPSDPSSAGFNASRLASQKFKVTRLQVCVV